VQIKKNAMSLENYLGAKNEVSVTRYSKRIYQNPNYDMMNDIPLDFVACLLTAILELDIYSLLCVFLFSVIPHVMSKINLFIGSKKVYLLEAKEL
jgi:hypothetical protein